MMQNPRRLKEGDFEAVLESKRCVLKEVEGVSMSSTSTSTDQIKSRGGTKTVPNKLAGGERWERVAGAVPGNKKTANQCKKKFALLKEDLRSKKSSAA
ncbi:hypothetical protein M0R45_003963 [Rubus argutus]|uniref:Myb-like domain-containing protein n=1 Tax=Rubus argutus TaxID=59490 RepID=A0AAW1YH17_RUBAR